MAAVALNNVAKVFSGGVRAVGDVCLEVAAGEFMVLLGPSGSGKTTLLRLIAGLERPTAGTITIAGRDVRGVAPKDRDVAMVFQSLALYPHLTVAQNLAFGLKMRGGRRDEIARRVAEAAGVLGIADLLSRMPGTLSGGQCQRVALGRAIVRRPAVFLFDEPLSNLDARLRIEMRAELKRLHRQLRTTMLYVTHDQGEAMTLGDRVAVLNGGAIQQVAAPLEIYERPCNQFVAGFVGTPPMNVLDGRVADMTDGTMFAAGEGLRLRLPAELAAKLAPSHNKAVRLGVRPEHINVVARAESASGSSRGPNAAADAKVEFVEHLGHMSVVHLSCGRQRLLASVDPASLLSAGQDVQITFEPARIHFFDAASGARLA